MRRYARPLLVLAVGGAVLAAALAVSTTLFFRLLSALGIGMMVCSALAVVLTFRKARRVSVPGLLVSIVVSLLSFLVYQAIMPIKAGGAAMFMAMLGGGVLGAASARTAELIADQHGVRSRGNAWYLAVWALILALTQCFALVAGRTPQLAMLMICLATGLVLGNSGTMALRAVKAQRQPTLPS